jgi:hypothetical protein
MSVAARPLFFFDNSFVRELEGLYVPWQGAPVAEPRLLALNEELAAELGADPAALRSPSPRAPRRSPRRTLGTSSGRTRPGSATAVRCCSARSSTSRVIAATCT